MAAGSVPKAGSKKGPCVETCGHRDCAEQRSIALAICPHCAESIGYETAFYNIDGYGYAHALCEEQAVEREVKKARIKSRL